MATTKIVMSSRGRLENALTNTSVKQWAFSLPNGFTCFRINNTVTDIPDGMEYMMGFAIRYGVNIRLILMNMFSHETFSAYTSNSGETWSDWLLIVGGGT